jgi:hypothetical protein
VRCRIDRVHLGQQRRREPLDLGQEHLGVVERQVTKLEVEMTVGTILSAVPPRITPVCTVVWGTSYAASNPPRSRNRRAV